MEAYETKKQKQTKESGNTVSLLKKKENIPHGTLAVRLAANIII